MANMSFMLTQPQMRSRQKHVTRRLGWRKLRPGQLIHAVEKAMGLKAGERVQKIALLRVVDVTVEPLRRLIDEPEYGLRECQQEGFGDHPTLSKPAAFVEFFCRSHRGCTPETQVTRIAFEFVDQQCGL